MKMLREYKNKRRFVSTGMHVADGRGPGTKSVQNKQAEQDIAE